MNIELVDDYSDYARREGYWKDKLSKLKRGKSFMAPAIKKYAICRSAYNMKKRVTTKQVVIVTAL